MAAANARVRGSGAALSVLLHAALIALLFALRPGSPPVAPGESLPLEVELEPVELPVPVIQRVPPAEAGEPSGGGEPLPAHPQPPPSVQVDFTPSVVPVVASQPAVGGRAPDAGSQPGAGVGTGGGTGSGSGSGSDDRRAGMTDADGGMARPDWIVKPTAEQQLAALSVGAQQARVPGGAVLSCLVTPRNRVRACKVLSETQGTYAFGEPYEFGRAALRLSRSFRVRPPVRDGRPRFDVRVRIPVYWDIR